MPLCTGSLWKIERLVPGGRGLTHLGDGRVGFAECVAPGDTVRVLEVKERKQFVEAIAWELVEASEKRVTPECAHFGRCGGCDWMHLARGSELEAKQALLTDALTRVGKLKDFPSIQLVAEPGPGATAYRNRQRFHVNLAGQVGLYSHNSHELVQVTSCAVSHPDVVAGLHALRRALEKNPGAGQWLAEAEVRTAPVMPKLAVRLVPRTNRFPASTPNSPEASARTLTLSTEKFVKELEFTFDLVTLGGYRDAETQAWPLTHAIDLVAPPAAFVQVNPEINRRLVAHVVERAVALGLRTFLDLYAGAGNFAIPLAARGLEGVALELSAPAVDAASSQIRALGLEARLTYVVGKVPDSIPALTPPRPLDLVVLDPPRAGAKECLRHLHRLAPSHIVYCACDPVSLARDLGELTRLGYRLVALTLFDMFPRTHHFESVAWLEREPLPGLSPERS